VKLEYLADGSLDCPLLRLFHFTPQEAAELHSAIAALSSGSATRIEVHRLPFIEPIGGCRLVLTLVDRDCDQAVRRGGEPDDFECGLTAVTWSDVAGLVEPFAEGGGGFQWLARLPGEPALLVSLSGLW
jgi:hypothetical protein